MGDGEKTGRPEHLPTRWLTEGEVLAYTHLARTLLHDLVAAGRLRPIRGSRRARSTRAAGNVYDLRDVDGLMEQLKVFEATAEAPAAPAPAGVPRRPATAGRASLKDLIRGGG